jgi:hypothetical protein
MCRMSNVELEFPLRMSPHAVIPAAGLACRRPAERFQPFLEICAAHGKINRTTIVVQKQALCAEHSAAALRSSSLTWPRIPSTLQSPLDDGS